MPMLDESCLEYWQWLQFPVSRWYLRFRQFILFVVFCVFIFLDAPNRLLFWMYFCTASNMIALMFVEIFHHHAEVHPESCYSISFVDMGYFSKYLKGYWILGHPSRASLIIIHELS